MSATETETDKTKEIPLGQRLRVEFTKIKKSADDTTGKRVVTQVKNIRWRLGGKFVFIQRGNNYHYVDTQELKWEQPKKGRGFWKLQYDENYCEPLGADGKAHRNPIVSLILRDEGMMQLVQIAQQFLPLQITKQMVVTMIVFGAMAALIGFGFNEIFHTAPITQVHWLPSKPGIIP